MTQPNMITIPLDEYRMLKDSRKLLLALLAYGVDKWEYYEDAFADFEDTKNDPA